MCASQSSENPTENYKTKNNNKITHTKICFVAAAAAAAAAITIRTVKNHGGDIFIIIVVTVV